MHKVKAVVVEKYTYRGPQKDNEDIWADEPYQRPIHHVVVLNTGHSTIVSMEQYESLKIGQKVIAEFPDVRPVFVASFVLFAMIVALFFIRVFGRQYGIVYASPSFLGGA